MLWLLFQNRLRVRVVDVCVIPERENVMNSTNNKYKTNVHISWKLILILLVFAGFLYGSTQEVNRSQLWMRRGLYYKMNSETPYTGRVIDKYPNGQKKSEVTYKNGRHVGTKSWDEKGNIKKPGRFKMKKIRTRYRRFRL